ncbi:MAG: KH domain-containing protein [Candidatus Eremiobacteraeota bacterium]|nr:KH domain-containing protein [Candidatus Eremiobacteraeota bacterium]
MSAFDDEFGLFTEATVEDAERPVLGRQPRPSRAASASSAQSASIAPPAAKAPSATRAPQRRTGRKPQGSAGDPWAGHRRATELLEFIARRLVQKPDSVRVELFIDEEGEPVIELVVDPEDLGKVIGRSGRVAQALRTVVRATAEGRLAVDILDSDEAAQGADASPDTGRSTSVGQG